MQPLITKWPDRSIRFYLKAAMSVVCLALLGLICSCTLIPVEPDNHIGPDQGTLGLDYSRIKSELYEQYAAWETVGFQHGGLSKNGVDCSGFVYLTFLEKFGVELPRSTAQQAEIGVEILQRDLRPGDLVFFKTGILARHVGIYIENRTFMHVSNKKGVSISSLDNAYWKKRYWQARRI